MNLAFSRGWGWSTFRPFFLLNLVLGGLGPEVSREIASQRRRPLYHRLQLLWRHGPKGNHAQSPLLTGFGGLFFWVLEEHTSYVLFPYGNISQFRGNLVHRTNVDCVHDIFLHTTYIYPALALPFFSVLVFLFKLRPAFIIKIRQTQR